MVRVMGMGSSVPFDLTDPIAPMNRRISILVLGRLGQERWARGHDTPISEAQALEQMLARKEAATPAPHQSQPATGATP